MPPTPDSSSSGLLPTGGIDPASPTHLEVRADPAVAAGEEAYLCFFLDGTALAGRYLRSLHWNPPAGPVVIHHATLFAGSGSGPLGPVSCDTPLDTSAVLHIYTPGAVPVALPDGVALQIAPGTTRLALQMHLLRLAEGQADVTSVDLELAADTPAHIAGWVDDRAPVPTLPPHAELASTGVCRFASAVHVVSTWPHMHQAGKSFYGTVVRTSGERQSLVEVPVWSFSHQPMYARDVALGPGDGVETLCVWENITDQSIEPGPYSHDEMCNQGLYVWPLESARCAP